MVPHIVRRALQEGDKEKEAAQARAVASDNAQYRERLSGIRQRSARAYHCVLYITAGPSVMCTLQLVPP